MNRTKTNTRQPIPMYGPTIDRYLAVIGRTDLDPWDVFRIIDGETRGLSSMRDHDWIGACKHAAAILDHRNAHSKEGGSK